MILTGNVWERWRPNDRLVLKCFYPECDVVFTTDEDEAYSHTDFIFCQMRVGKKQKCAPWMRKFLLSTV